jgi:hypothetical protein
MKESGELSGSLPGCSVYPANKSWGKPQIRQSFCSNAMTDCIIEIQRLKFDPAHTAHMRGVLGLLLTCARRFALMA